MLFVACDPARAGPWAGFLSNSFPRPPERRLGLVEAQLLDTHHLQDRWTSQYRHEGQEYHVGDD